MNKRTITPTNTHRGKSDRVTLNINLPFTTTTTTVLLQGYTWTFHGNKCNWSGFEGKVLFLRLIGTIVVRGKETWNGKGKEENKNT